MLFIKLDGIAAGTVEKGIKPPKTVSQQNKDKMMSGDGMSPLPSRPNQASAKGMACGKCGHHHKPGSICSFDKSDVDGLSSLLKGNPNRLPKGAPNGSGGQFTTSKRGVKDSTPMKHSGPHGSGDGDGKKTKDDAGVVSTSEGIMSSKEFKDAKETKQSRPNVQNMAQDPKVPTGASEPKGKQQPGLKGDATMAGKVSAKKPSDGGGVEGLMGAESGPKDPVKQAVEESVADAESIGMREDLGRQYVHEAAIQAAMEADPKKFEGGPLTPRAERPTPAREPGMPQKQGTNAMDPWTTASVEGNRSAQKEAAERVRKMGGDSMDQAIAGQAAWVESNNAYKEAMEAGIDPAEVPGRRKELSDQWNRRQSGGVEDLMKPADTQPTQALQSATRPPQPPSQPTQNITTGQPTSQPAPTVDMSPATQEQKVAPTVLMDPSEMPQAPAASPAAAQSPQEQASPQQGAQDSSMYDKMVSQEKYGRVYDRAINQGFSPQDAHTAASQHSGISVEDGWQSPGQKKQSAKEAKAAEKQAKQQEGARQKQLAQGTRDTKVKQPAKQGIGFAPAYSQGAAIGSSQTSDSGVVAPTASFAAQRAHHLLNPKKKNQQSYAQVRQAPKANIAKPPQMGKSIEMLLGI